jgi:very-short-patch-repair endonuclease
MDNEQIIQLGKALRRQGTPVERILWQILRNRQLAGVKFRRQQSLGTYIVDFVCYERKLIIEIDGGQHNQERIASKDDTRTKWLNSQGFQVIRFWNSDVTNNYEGVLNRVREIVGIEAPSPLIPLPSRERKMER